MNNQFNSQNNGYGNPNGGMNGNASAASNDEFFANARNSIDYQFIKMGFGIHLILFLFTCGIWSLIWIYRVTRYLNNFNTNTYREPINKLLLCIFVPFYIIYWFYITGQIIDNIKRSRNQQSDVAMILAVVSIISIAACIWGQMMIEQLDEDGNNFNPLKGIVPNNNTPQGPQGMNQQYNQNYQQPINNPNTQQVNVPYQQPNVPNQQANVPNQQAGAPNQQPNVPNQQAGVPNQQVNEQTNNQPDSQTNVDSGSDKVNDQVEDLKKIKELLDNGIITQEEFEKMKNDILN